MNIFLGALLAVGVLLNVAWCAIVVRLLMKQVAFEATVNAQFTNQENFNAQQCMVNNAQTRMNYQVATSMSMPRLMAEVKAPH